MAIEGEDNMGVLDNPEPEPDHEKLEWRGVKFVWSPGGWASFQVRYPRDAGFNGNVHPRGRFWDATLHVGKDEFKGSGETPGQALDAAALAWCAWVTARAVNLSALDTLRLCISGT